VVALEAREVEVLRESLDRLQLEVEELRASRACLARAADADRSRIERELHDGPQQDLVSLAVELQLAGRLMGSDPAEAMALLNEMRRHVQEALDRTRELAHRIYPPLLEAGGLGAALRTAAASAGVPSDIQVTTGGTCPPEIAASVYFCWVEVLERGAVERATITVHPEDGALVFEIVATTEETDLALQKHRVEALGGRLAVASKPGRGIWVSGSLPVSR
jgi:signal transduction histidine kinase